MENIYIIFSSSFVVFRVKNVSTSLSLSIYIYVRFTSKRTWSTDLKVNLFKSRFTERGFSLKIFQFRISPLQIETFLTRRFQMVIERQNQIRERFFPKWLISPEARNFFPISGVSYIYIYIYLDPRWIEYFYFEKRKKKKIANNTNRWKGLKSNRRLFDATNIIQIVRFGYSLPVSIN